MTYSLEMTEQFTCSRTAEEAFNYIVDFSRIHEWDHTIRTAKKTTKGTLGLGTVFDLEYSMGLRRIPIQYEITKFEPNRRATLRGSSANFTAIDTVTIEPNEHEIQVNWHAKIEFNGLATKIVPLLEKRIKAAGRRTIKDLALALEDDFSLPKLNVGKKMADTLILPGLAQFTKFGYGLSQKSWNPMSNDVRGQHMLVTGATSGLGLATAQALAHRGAHLTLVARDPQKANQVKEEISTQTGNPNIDLELANLSEMTQVVQLADRLIKKARPIDVLINNAGALFNPRRENSDGLEMSFALLLLGPVILTERLKPLLTRDSKEQRSSRVINVSSGGMYVKRISLGNIESSKGKYSGADAYARSKRGLVMAGEKWAEDWLVDGVVTHSMHPGWAKTPGVEEALPGFNKKMQRVLRTPEQGADTIIWLACASEINQASGLFWLDREPHSTHLTNKTRETEAQRAQLFQTLQSYAQQYGVDLDLAK